MLRSSKLVLAALIAVCVLAAIVANTSARRLEISPAERGLRIVWPSYKVLVGWESFEVIVACPVTLEGSLHSRTLSKVCGALVGYITRATVNEGACRASYEPEMTGTPAKSHFLAETLPWHVRYESFTGTLPSIASVTFQVVGAALRVYELPLGESCLYRSTAAAPMRYLLERGMAGEVTGLTNEESRLIPNSEGSPQCSTRGLGYSGTGTVSVLGTTTGISLRLVS